MTIRSAGWQLLGCLAVTALCIAACEDDVVFSDDGPSTGGAGGGSGGMMGTGGSGLGGATTSSQVDVLIVVDNSRGVAHMQAVLADSVGSLVDGLTTAGVKDMHLGVISSSLGGLGADACSGASSLTENDRAWLLTRGAETYDDLGFLAWDPNQTLTPPGEANSTALGSTLSDLVLGAGDEGCGYESQLEAFYRFLIDPDPYADVELSNNEAMLIGTDTQLLQQRSDFLRDDSLVLIVIATDENDCSTRDGGQFYFARQIYTPGSNNPYHLPPARAACATDPGSACCQSCGQNPGAGCDTSQDQCGGSLSALEDNINLRCFDQKRRFGIDFLWPMDRYEQGLSAAQVTDRHGNVVANPLFANGRGSELVLVAGVVGVPWQLVARGGNASNGMKTADEIAADGGWGALIGDPENYVPASDPHMVESIDPRAGVAGPGSTHDADEYNGHDFSVPQRDDLQYACVWDLAAPVDCTGQQNCECNDPMNDNPACQDPATNLHGTDQYRAIARPGTRPLALLESLGHRGVVGSICPAQISNPGAADFGYAPTFSTLVELASERFVD